VPADMQKAMQQQMCTRQGAQSNGREAAAHA